MEWTRLRPTAYGRGSELTQSARTGRSGTTGFGTLEAIRKGSSQNPRTLLVDTVHREHLVHP